MTTTTATPTTMPQVPKMPKAPSQANPINWFRRPSAEALAAVELAEAKRNLLESQRQRDYHTKMEEYYTLRISRIHESLQGGAYRD